jgi:hypothetical protein
MEHLTNFEVVLVIASTICLIYGYIGFIKIITKR